MDAVLPTFAPVTLRWIWPKDRRVAFTHQSLADVVTIGGHAHDHRALRWAVAADLDRLDWVPADRAWVAELTRALAGSLGRDRRR